MDQQEYCRKNNVKFIVKKILTVNTVGTFIYGIIPRYDPNKILTLELKDFNTEFISPDDCFLCDITAKDGNCDNIEIKIITKMPKINEPIKNKSLHRAITNIDYSAFVTC